MKYWRQYVRISDATLIWTRGSKQWKLCDHKNMQGTSGAKQLEKYSKSYSGSCYFWYHTPAKAWRSRWGWWMHPSVLNKSWMMILTWVQAGSPSTNRVVRWCIVKEHVTPQWRLHVLGSTPHSSRREGDYEKYDLSKESCTCPSVVHAFFVSTLTSFRKTLHKGSCTRYYPDCPLKKLNGDSYHSPRDPLLFRAYCLVIEKTNSNP